MVLKKNRPLMQFGLRRCLAYGPWRIKTPAMVKKILVVLTLPNFLSCSVLVVASSAKQKQQHHHQQLTNGSTILKMFMFPENLDLFNLSAVSFGSILARLLK
jgi:hypothetical protein